MQNPSLTDKLIGHHQAISHFIREAKANKISYQITNSPGTILINSTNPKTKMAIKMTQERHGLQSVKVEKGGYITFPEPQA